jgi:hypothetical protein
MEIKYQTFVEKNLLLLQYKGSFCIDKYEAQVIDMIQKPEWKSINKIFLDLRFLKLDSNINVNLIDTLIDIKANIVKKKHFSVQLVDNSLITALAHLYQQELSNIDLETEYCSTIKKAIELLELNVKEDEFEATLKNLEHTF